MKSASWATTDETKWEDFFKMACRSEHLQRCKLGFMKVAITRCNEVLKKLSFRPSISDDLKNLISSMLKKDPGLRISLEEIKVFLNLVASMKVFQSRLLLNFFRSIEIFCKLCLLSNHWIRVRIVDRFLQILGRMYALKLFSGPSVGDSIRQLSNAFWTCKLLSDYG